MFMYVIALAVGLGLHEQLVRADAVPAWSAAALLALAWLPRAAMTGAYWLAAEWAGRRLGQGQGRGHRALTHLGRLGGLTRVASLGLFALELRLGLPQAIRGLIGDTILLDEVACMAAPLLMVVGQWAAYYGVDLRVREASLIRRMDQGLPALPIWTRGQYLLAQTRHHLATVLTPLLPLMAWEELVRTVEPRFPQVFERVPAGLLVLAGAVSLFLLAPAMIRHLWDTTPLPAGDLRRRLEGMCRQYRVGYRQLLLWRTFGGMGNAAVMGLLPPLRYILVTDALLEGMSDRQVEAVMAHEIAHIRRHHIGWLLLAVMTGIALLDVLSRVALAAARPWLPEGLGLTLPLGDGEAVAVLPSEAAAAVLVLAGALWIFGWISRRFERQADTFAVQHLSAAAGDRVTPEGAAAMVEALQQVADLNHIAVRRRSWRHGSIAWRQDYLRGLVGLPLDRLAIDRQVRWIKAGTLLALAAVVVLEGAAALEASAWLPG